MAWFAIVGGSGGGMWESRRRVIKGGWRLGESCSWLNGFGCKYVGRRWEYGLRKCALEQLFLLWDFWGWGTDGIYLLYGFMET